MTLKSKEEAIGRVAALASDVLCLVSHPTLVNNAFEIGFKSRASAQSEIIHIASRADPFATLLSHLEEKGNANLTNKLIAVTAASDQLLLGIPHLSKLSSLPITIHLTLVPSNFPDYGEIMAIRNTGFTILQSFTLQEAQDMAFAAHSIAIKSRRGVIHFFEATDQSSDSILEEDFAILQKMVNSDEVAAAKSVRRILTSIYWDYYDWPKSSSPKEDITETSPSTGSMVEKTKDDTNADYCNPNSLDIIISAVLYSLRLATGRDYKSIEYFGSASAITAVLVFGSNVELFKRLILAVPRNVEYATLGLASIRIYRPSQATAICSIFPVSIKKICIAEQIKNKTSRWGPIYLDFIIAFNSVSLNSRPKFVGAQLGYLDNDTAHQALLGVAQNLKRDEPVQDLIIGLSKVSTNLISGSQNYPSVENTYYKVLHQLFSDSLEILNQEDQPTFLHVNTSPEYHLGRICARIESRIDFMKCVSKSVSENNDLSPQLKSSLSDWLMQANDRVRSRELAVSIINLVSENPSQFGKYILSQRHLLPAFSSWLVGSDAWAYDIGNSGVHHLLTSGKNINMLIIDSQPHSLKAEAVATMRKKDIGLYAMNFGNAYVASVAVYSSYTQLLHALLEADSYDGPAIVLAYLPMHTVADNPINILQETKKAVDSGYWPLYRWNPSIYEAGAEKMFQLDSERIKKQLRDFLGRENKLSHLVLKDPALSPSLIESYTSNVSFRRKTIAKQAYERMIENLSGPPLTILFASDGGNAESLAKRLQRRAKARGLKATVMAMDNMPVEELMKEINFVIITSVAGQGEFPQNGRELWEAIRNGTDLDFTKSQYSVFGLGDRDYWPRKEDKIYFNKAARDIDAKLEALGGSRFVPLGLGDDQDPDGYETAYAVWEPDLWKVFKVDHVLTGIEEPKPLTNEDLKIQSNFLRGTIAQALDDISTGSIGPDDAQLTKFHGTYMQDDRDLRDQRRQEGREPAYIFMIRVRMPGGVCTPKQWLAMDKISNDYGDHTMKLTTRQTFQFHGVLKGNLRESMRAINQQMLTTLGACGDVVRNVCCANIPTLKKLHREVYALAAELSSHFLPATNAYHEIWLSDGDSDDGKKFKVAGDALQDSEPFYTPVYLPRKFKIAFAVPPDNDVDIFTNDLGFIAIQKLDGTLEGFNTSVGGGMGTTHNNAKTYPRLGSVIGFVPADQVKNFAEAVITTQRDFGNRTDRKIARLKYTIDHFDGGLEGFKAEVERRLGFLLEPARPFQFTHNTDNFGWIRGDDGFNHFTIFIENGRVGDTLDWRMKEGLVCLAKQMVDTEEFRLTMNQHLILCNVADNRLEFIQGILAKHRLDNISYSGLRLSSSACVGFPTCGLAMAESERFLPGFITKLEDAIQECGLSKDEIVLRVSGCANGCSRPYAAEVALVGKAPGYYNLHIGGGFYGQRLNQMWKASVSEDEILDLLNPLIKQYAIERQDGQRFGDFCLSHLQSS